MGKILNPYGHYTSGAIISKATTGICTLTDTGSTVDATNITVTGIKNVLGADSTSVSALCKHNNVNKWSHFSPYNASRNGSGTVDFSWKTPYQMGYFAGYKHDALPSTYYYDRSKPATSTVTKNSSYQYTFGYLLSRGDRVPVGITDGWTYVRLKIVITDTTNTRTITGYSAIQAVTTSSFTAFSVTFTDTLNTEFSGSMVVTAEYVNSTGTTIYGYVEDSYPTVTLTVNGYYITFTSANFQNTHPMTLRWYYVQNTIAPNYNTLVYNDYGTDIKICNTSPYSSLVTTASALVGRTTSGTQIPYRYGTSYPAEQWPLVYAVAYDSSTGIYRKYTVTEISGGTVFDTIYKAPTDMSYIYKLTYSGTLTGWPTTL